MNNIFNQYTIPFMVLVIGLLVYRSKKQKKEGKSISASVTSNASLLVIAGIIGFVIVAIGCIFYLEHECHGCW